ncbi:MAG: APC family permease [Rhodospirillales bacterium]
MTAPHLRRVLGVPLLVGYGIGVIVGAGIYVLVGEVVSVAGNFAPLSFLLAGALAALVAICYGDLAARFPEAAGAPAYVQEAFGSSALSRAVGAGVAAVVATSTAALARGSVGYVQVFLALPGASIAGALCVVATAIACLNVRQSVALAAGMSAVEVGGLLLVVAAGWSDLPGPGDLAAALPSLGASFSSGGVAAGMFLAFFAYIGFENMANMAEEARDSRRTMPQAMFISLAISTILYLLVVGVAAAVMRGGGPAAGAAPLLAVGQRTGWYSPAVFAAVALIAVSNGVLIEIIMLSRLFYGMARRGWLPSWLCAVDARTATPLRATLVAGAVVLALTLALDLGALASAASAATLLVFAVVAAALWRLQYSGSPARGFAAPRFVPPLAAALCLALAAAQLFVGR